MSGSELASAVSAALDPLQFMRRVCDRTLELIAAADGVAVGIADTTGISYVCGAGAASSAVGTTVVLDASLSGLALRTGCMQQASDTRFDLRVDSEACLELAVMSLVCIPLHAAGDVFGVMAVSAAVTKAFTKADVAVLTQLAEFVSVAIASVRDLDRVSQQLIRLTTPGFGSASDTSDEIPGRYMMNVIDPEVVARVDARRSIRRVLDDPNAVSTVFQPIVDLVSGAIVAVEALSRFEIEPIRSPDRWFNDAHCVGLGVEMEVLAVSRALQYLPTIPEPIALTINVGPDTMVNADLVRTLSGVPARRVVLELTEHAAIDDYPELQASLLQHRRSGLRLAVDDTGSGYSSLSHILKLAPDFIKLDRELILGIDLDPVRRALVTSLVTFARDTGAEILAEGVETREELETVRRLGVRYAQGYYLGRPAPLDSLPLHDLRPHWGQVGCSHDG